METIDLFNELLENNTINDMATKLNLHIGTVRRWKSNNSVPKNYFNDLNSLLDNKYDNKDK